VAPARASDIAKLHSVLGDAQPIGARARSATVPLCHRAFRRHRENGEGAAVARSAYKEGGIVIKKKPLYAVAALVLGAAMGPDASVVVAQPAMETGEQLFARLDAMDFLPPSVTRYSQRYYDGESDDLLTAGLGKTGLGGAAPLFADPSAPTPAELRRSAIWNNYRAVLDISAAGGYGTLYGPNVTNQGVVKPGEGKIAGWEFIAYADDGSGEKNVTVMVQLPDTFDPQAPCIVAATAPGSRGIYGAIGASGEWGLKQGCAVAYTDKGAGNGLHDLMTNSVGLIDGRRADADEIGTASHFTADVSDAERAAFNLTTPHRVAYKHAHSQQNPERSWGRNTLQAVRFAFLVLNEHYGKTGPDGTKPLTIRPENTIVIASGISNGATSALQAVERDNSGLIDGVAINAPDAQPGELQGVQIVQGSRAQLVIGRPLLDYVTFANLYQPCAALALAPADTAGHAIVNLLTPSVIAAAAGRCRSLAEKGLVKGGTTAKQAAEALATLHSYGWLRDSDTLHLSHYAFATPSIATTHSNALGRFSVLDNLCGFSFANTTESGNPVAQNPIAQVASFATGSGLPPTAGTYIVYNLAANGPGGKQDFLASSPSTRRVDLALDGALCLRGLIEGIDPGVPGRLLRPEAGYARRVQRGVAEVQLSGQLRGKPALIVHGRADALLPVNHSSRAYYALNQSAEGEWHRHVRYVEVANAQHFDAYLGFPGYAERFVPLQVYLIHALNRMYAHLAQGAPLPPSQVIRAKPRGRGAPPITAANVPGFGDEPSPGDQIRFSGGTLYVPD
jgi:hydroxybutyrate-dimer hydrolase